MKSEGSCIISAVIDMTGEENTLALCMLMHSLFHSTRGCIEC